jgi:SAM-dependent methyltransferase
MKFYNPVLFILLLCLTFAWLYLYWYRKNYGDFAEGFQQQRAFISKSGVDIYDSFYAEIYDELMLSEQRAQDLMDAIVHVSQPNLRYSSFLDVGCGTGAMMDRLVGAGYKAVGIDRSPDMIDYCQQKYFDSEYEFESSEFNSSFLEPFGSAFVGKDTNILVGDVLDSMQFDRSQFSHIICSGMTLYEWKENEVLRFFKNCYFWMIAGGYLFVHLVDPLMYSPVALAAIDVGSVGSVVGSQITNTEIDFLDFAYKSNYIDVGNDLGNNDTTDKNTCACTAHRESFIDAKTGHVRENEILLYMHSLDDIVSMALRSGFVVKAKWNLLDSPYSDAYQYIYMFERTL